MVPSILFRWLWQASSNCRKVVSKKHGEPLKLVAYHLWATFEEGGINNTLLVTKTVPKDTLSASPEKTVTAEILQQNVLQSMLCISLGTWYRLFEDDKARMARKSYCVLYILAEKNEVCLIAKTFFARRFLRVAGVRKWEL